MQLDRYAEQFAALGFAIESLQLFNLQKFAVLEHWWFAFSLNEEQVEMVPV